MYKGSIKAGVGGGTGSEGGGRGGESPEAPTGNKSEPVFALGRAAGR